MSSKVKTTGTKENGKHELVPKLRFPEFRGTEGWEQTFLGAVATLRNGYAFKSSDYVDSGPFQIITIANVQQGVLTLDATKKIAKLPVDIQAHQNLRFDDILISMTGNVGRVCRVTCEALLLNQRVGKLVPEEIDSEFFYHLLQRDEFRNSMQLKAAGGAQGNLSSGAITEYTLHCPADKAEQQKIAECLSSVDEVIAAQARKVDVLKTHKKGLMQQLFPREGQTQPRLRFPEFQNAGEWEETTIGDLKPYVTSGSRGWAPFYAEQGELFVRITNMWRDSIYLDLTDSKYVQLPPGANEGVRTQLKEHDVLISITADIGIISYVDESIPSPAYINQHIALVRFDEGQLSGKYVAYFLASERSQQLFRASTDTGTKAGMNLIGIQKIGLILPSRPEQQRIADHLSTLDALITAATQKFDALKLHKRGLMQQLFPSPEEA